MAAAKSACIEAETCWVSLQAERRTYALRVLGVLQIRIRLLLAGLTA